MQNALYSPSFFPSAIDSLNALDLALLEISALSDLLAVALSADKHSICNRRNLQVNVALAVIERKIAEAKIHSTALSAVTHRS